ncbi:cbb3-type cytochrome oxidase assembly protein CcoS [Roseobacter sp. GAI101]|uniref:cbb3-type cytochrome oxidase assembly protein CcoS n=1 Tax=Roseobacter sp. (strain GAI101) TaxID=391589 RepID=UPI0001871982|nr:cbb3-type cytochrome oxidase assembly protein CcoS [Roseobacter sp. GAI101]EEB86347.1 cytochrome oxidase maturation protein, cbb3-type [Roseobacter sp. GAI101]
MNVLLILIPVSIILGGLGLCGFLWTLRSGQYDDAEGSAARLLLEDDDAPNDAPDEPRS